MRGALLGLALLALLMSAQALVPGAAVLPQVTDPDAAPPLIEIDHVSPPPWVRAVRDLEDLQVQPWDVLEAAPPQGAPGLRLQPFSIETTMGLGMDLVRRPLGDEGTSSDDGETGRFDRYPVPAGDVDGDGVEDIHLVGFLYDEPQEETSLVTVSGADGSVIRELPYAADVILPSRLLDTDDGPLELILVQEERFVVPWDDEYEVWYWSGTLYAYHAGTSEVAWSVHRPAALEPDGSGWIAYTSVGWAGPYLPSGVRAIESEGLVSWTETIRNYTLTAEVRLVDPQNRSEVYTFAPDALPFWYWDTGEDRDFYRLVNGSIERRDGADNTALWTGANPGFHVNYAEPVTVNGGTVLLADAHNATGTSMAVIDGQGETLWSRHHADLPRWTFPVGVSSQTGDEHVAFASLDFSCPGERIPYRIGMVELGAGEIVWERTGDAADMRLFALAAGDLDGDGVGDPVIFRDGTTTTAVLSSESCFRETHMFIVDQQDWIRVEVFSAADGTQILDTGEYPTEGISLVALNWWAYDRPYETVPLMHSTYERGPTGARDHLDLTVYHPGTHAFTQRHVETYRRDPYAGGGHGSLSVAPVGFFHGPLDTIYVHAWDRYGTDHPANPAPENFSRTALYAHDAIDGDAVWSFHRGQASYDGPIPWV